MARKGKAEKEVAPHGQPDSAKNIKDLDLAGDAATIIGTAIGVVGGAAGFVGSKVAEAISGKSEKKPPSKKAGKTAGAKRDSTKKTTSKKAGRTSGAEKKAARKRASKKTGSGNKTSPAKRTGDKKAISRKK